MYSEGQTGVWSEWSRDNQPSASVAISMLKDNAKNIYFELKLVFTKKLEVQLMIIHKDMKCACISLTSKAIFM